MGRGPIHEDANVGNLLVDSDGSAVLTDLDGFCIGPREWDLIQTALFYDRLGWHDQSEYEAFVSAYGTDLLTWPGYPTLADSRELVMTSWLAGAAEGSSRKREELLWRVRDLREANTERSWRPL